MGIPSMEPLRLLKAVIACLPKQQANPPDRKLVRGYFRQTAAPLTSGTFLGTVGGGPFAAPNHAGLNRRV
jgi:hypothetical protein